MKTAPPMRSGLLKINHVYLGLLHKIKNVYKHSKVTVFHKNKNGQVLSKIL